MNLNFVWVGTDMYINKTWANLDTKELTHMLLRYFLVLGRLH